MGSNDSMSTLKQVDYNELRADTAVSEKLKDYDIIIELCKTNQTLPYISLDKSSGILRKIKKNVKDHLSITSLHYINAGGEGQLHFCELLNGVISDLNNASLEELNRAHGLIYYKGHLKDKTSDRSYRTISSCPLLSKALDLYRRDLYSDLWPQQQAPTQYQGVGSCHPCLKVLKKSYCRKSCNWIVSVLWMVTVLTKHIEDMKWMEEYTDRLADLTNPEG